MRIFRNLIDIFLGHENLLVHVIANGIQAETSREKLWYFLTRIISSANSLACNRIHRQSDQRVNSRPRDCCSEHSLQCGLNTHSRVS